VLQTPTELLVPLESGGTVTALVYGAVEGRASAALVLAHGAGAGQRSPFMAGFAKALAALGVDAMTFNFPYAEQRRRLPDRRPVLHACYRSAVHTARRHVESAGRCLFIGGKSMGGRMATEVAAADKDLAVSGLVLLGYPLHPPGRPADLRAAHLPGVNRPMLFVQGTRDSFGTPAELGPILTSLTPPTTLHVVAGGDHSFKVARASQQEQAAVFDDVQRTIAEWIERVIASGASGTHQPPR
jgi:predicted alpha/beta-hydrolase family hydrolase